MADNFAVYSYKISINMNLNNFTLKAQESVQQAFNIAASKGQQAVECAHLLKGVMSEAESITGFLFGKWV